MKTIIIPTDFSAAADNAAHYGVQLAGQLGAQVLLLHVYTVPVSMSDVPVLMISAEELKRGADEGLERSRAELEKAYAGVPVRLESRLGDVISELNDISEKEDPLLVVMGTHGTSGFEQLLFGSTAISAIKKCNYPVLTVPEHCRYQNIQTIVLAADLLPISLTTQQQVVKVVQLFNSQLHIAHIQISDEKESGEPQLVQQLRDVTPVYYTAQQDNISEGLHQYIQQAGADLLIVLPHQHNLIESLFFKMHTKDIIKNAQVPVLCIRA